MINQMLHRDVVKVICSFLPDSDNHAYLSCCKELYKIKQHVIFNNNIELDKNIRKLSFYNSFSQVTTSDCKIINNLTTKITRYSANKTCTTINNSTIKNTRNPTNKTYRTVENLFILNLKLTLNSDRLSMLGLPTKLKYLNIFQTTIIDRIMYYSLFRDRLNFLSISKFIWPYRKKIIYDDQIYLNSTFKSLPYYDNLTNCVVQHVGPDLPKKLTDLTIQHFKNADVEILSKFKKLTYLGLVNLECNKIYESTIILENLKSLTIGRLQHFDRSIFFAFQNITDLFVWNFKNVNLQSLSIFKNLRHCAIQNFTSCDLRAIVNFENLEHLTVENFGPTDEEIFFIMQNFEYLNSEFYFFEKITTITINDFRPIDAQILFNFPNLTRVIVYARSNNRQEIIKLLPKTVTDLNICLIDNRKKYFYRYKN